MNKKTPIAPKYIKDFEQLGFGMFVHYGLYSQLNSGEWTFHNHHRNMDEYMKLKDTFKPVSMKNIVDVGKKAGCKYICLTTRHHEGFSLYDTKGLNDFDAVHSPAQRDVVAEFVEECRKADIVPFFYHTTADWYNRDFFDDFPKYLDYLNKSVELLCKNYGKIGGLWFDGNWWYPDYDWQEDRLYKMIRSYQPEAMIVNNTGLDARGEMGNAEIDAVTYERGMPKPLDLSGREKYVSGEMCESLFDHWGVADDYNYKSPKALIEALCECRKVGANFLLNIGPNGDATVPKMQEAIMEIIGDWMNKFGEAIYNGRPYIIYDNERDFWLKDANNPKIAYIFKFDLGIKDGNEHVTIGFAGDDVTLLPNVDKEVESVSWMDNNENLEFVQEGDLLKLKATGYSYGTGYCVRVAKVKFK